jgi:hypothetical protein
MSTESVKETEGFNLEPRNDHDPQDEGPGSASSNVQFQVVTLFVWIGAFALLILGVKHAREAHVKPPKLIMPVVHLVPWCIALLERRRIRKSLPLTPQYQSLAQTAITRVSWVGYVILSLVEYWLY